MSESGRGRAVLYTARWTPAGELLSRALTEVGTPVPLELVDVDEEPGRADRHLVVSLPTLVVERDGRELGRLLGAFSAEDALKAMRRAAGPDTAEADTRRKTR